jgi:hypothetical protein
MGMEPLRRGRLDSGMKTQLALAALVIASVAACAAPAPDPTAPAGTATARPLDTLPAEADLARVREDLLATAADRFGAAALSEARAAPAHLVVKRFVGMAPPPPPGAGADWKLTPAAALLARRAEGWMVATGSGWRRAGDEAATELDQIMADPALWSEPAYTPPCPDFGASLLLLKAPGQSETVRNSLCMSRASRIVEAALRA